MSKNNLKNTVLDVLIVGAGFAGMYMLYKFREQGLSVQVLDEASGVGGTWYWNRYPGARCDVESMEYSYSFSDDLQQEWNWSHRFSTQPEILKYANHVADRFSLREWIEFESRVESMVYSDQDNLWETVTDSGAVYKSRYCVMATGTLSSVNKPQFKGIAVFKGESYVTGRWPHESVDFSGKKVAIIGTGSSAVQAIPVIAAEAKTLTVFQRTANYSIPAQNRPLSSEEIEEVKAEYPEIRAKARSNRAGIASMEIGSHSALDVGDIDRNAEFNRRWQEGGTNFLAAYNDIGINANSNKKAADFVISKIHEAVKDPEVADLLSPSNTIGCKRLCADTDYYETYNRENVSLVDVNKTPIERIVEEGVKTSDKVYEFDIIIFAIGFDAMTGALMAIDIKGRDGYSLKEKWTNGPRTFLGLCSERFPNMFMITGPGSPSVLSNMMTSIEQHVEWISECVAYMYSNGYSAIEPIIDSENKWMDHVEEIAAETLRYSCNSWYVGANIPGKKRVFLPYAGGLPQYTDKCNEVVAGEYEGFSIS